MGFVFKIRSSVKNYEWGKLGNNSAVAQLQKSFEDFVVHENTPYAEMWMGTHCSGPATIPSLNDMKLSDWIKKYPESLGLNVTSKFGNCEGLPFLFKVLSVSKALSIQAHPDKQTAKKLRNNDPNNYPDDNHKPEMAIALTDFEALCGFRPVNEIKTFLKVLPHVREVVGFEIADKFLQAGTEKDLKSLFTSLMKCSSSVFQPQLFKLLECFKSGKYESELCKSLDNLLIKTVEQYPGDIGCFCLFFLNFLKLKPGEAIYLAANEPHAYLSGDCIECMACSDNVVRAGLTPKFRDVSTLCDILTYNCKPAKENFFLPFIDPEDVCVKIYNPPVSEFAVDQISIVKHDSYSLKTILSASILLIVKGTTTYKYEDEGGLLTCGSVLFISSGSQVTFNPVSDLLMFRAYCSD